MAAAWFSAVLLPVGSLVCSESFNVDCLGMDTYFVDMGLWFPLNFFTKVYMIIAVITCFCYILMILSECKKISCFHENKMAKVL